MIEFEQAARKVSVKSQGGDVLWLEDAQRIHNQLMLNAELELARWRHAAEEIAHNLYLRVGLPDTGERLDDSIEPRTPAKLVGLVRRGIEAAIELGEDPS